MIGPSRELITNTFNNHYNENLSERFFWGLCKKNDYDDEIYLKVNDNYQKYLYPYNGPPTKISFDILKKAWYKALNEIIEITENISDDTLVCIASY